MSDTPTPAPAPAPVTTLPPEEVLAVARLIVSLLGVCRGAHSRTVGAVSTLWSLGVRYAGVAALALVLLSGKGCTLPSIHFPWPIPTPAPVPPSPIPGGSLRVMVVYDSGKPLPKEQTEILSSADFRTWLKGQNADFRFFADGTDASNEADPWKTVLSRPRTSLPWIVVGNSKTGFEGALPATLDATKTLIQKYAAVPPGR